ncbi:lactoylglutathione lyase [Cucumis melo var. makuwa]|uniref:Lactoylglutathione lyase n=1 Tax=Cucumis melo var. makuwa TaxID=1194695 RepID=A0A5D3D2A2_CUCMM|nr:lactoylglutathione lyase [Cucumis melo var. makuwa]TYK17780.1 lactoylglutathione lyase [Cucumis melo var. makuwa]
MAFPVAKAASLAHIARESSNIHRLSQFYKEMFGFEEIESPDFGALKVIWLNLPSAFQLHLIERDPNSKLPEGPCSATSPVADPSHLPRGHHICFSVPISNFDSLVHALKEKGIQTFEKTLPNGKVKQVFFFDPDGNGLEIASRED